MNSLKKAEGAPLLNFEGGPGVPLLYFEEGTGVPLLNFEEGPGSRVPGSRGPGVLVPLLHHAFFSNLINYICVCLFLNSVQKNQ